MDLQSFSRTTPVELSHAYRLFDYINETGEQALVHAIPEPKSEFRDLREVFQLTYEHELTVSTSILSLADTAMTEKDYSTFNFLQWYLNEQHEEERLFKDILDKIDIIK